MKKFLLLLFCIGTLNAALAQIPVTITPPASPTNSSNIDFLVIFDSPVENFDDPVNDITITGTALATTGVISGSGTTYTVTVSGMTTSGTVELSIPAGIANLVGDPLILNDASSVSSVDFDNVAPTVTVNQAGGQPDPTSASPVLFTVVFIEPINVSTFTNGDVTLSGTATGTSVSVSETGPLNGTTFTISVSVTGGGTVIASLAAGVVSDPAGNANKASTFTDNEVTFQSLPNVTTPTVADIATNEATLGGNVVSTGGGPLSARGTVWSTSSPVNAANNPLAAGGTGTGVFSHTRSSLPAGTRIFFRAYAANAAGTALSPESSFFTFSAIPGSQNPNFTASPQNTTSVLLGFNVASTITDADGYVILRGTGASQIPQVTHVQDGVAPASLVTGTSVLVAHITSLSQTDFTDTGLTPGTDYRYAIVPYNWDGINPETYNYRQGAGPSFPSIYNAQAITFSNQSHIALNGGTTTNIAYGSYQTASGLNMGNSVSLATFRLYDGRSPDPLVPDADNVGTTLTSLTISIANHDNLQAIAIFDGGSNLREITPVTTGSVTFSSLSISAADDGFKDFNIRATFKPLVTDNQPITLTITNAVAAPTGSVFAAPAAGGATTGGATNRIHVVATRVAFTTTSITTDVNVDFSLTARALDGLNNRDLDAASNVTLLLTGGPGTLDPSPQSATRAFVAGEVSWTSLSIDRAGAGYVIEGEHSSLTDAFVPVVINSLGVTITGPANQNFCFGGSFQPLTNIVLTETDPSDFAVGTNVTYSIILPAGFEFNTAVLPTLSEVGTNITALTSTTPAYPAANIYRFQYTSGTIVGALDQITISGLRVRYTGTTAVSNQQLLRIGGSAMVSGSPLDPSASHGTVSASQASPPVGFDFTVEALAGNPPVAPTKTNYTTGDQNVELVGSPSGGIFSGNGVAFSAGVGYVFSASAAGTGDHSITYRYTDAVSPNCRSELVKVFRVTSTNIIQNLNPVYCLNDPPSPTLTVTAARIATDFPPDPLHIGAVYNLHSIESAVGLTGSVVLLGIPIPIRTYAPYSAITQFNPGSVSSGTILFGVYNASVRYRVTRSSDGAILTSPAQVVTINPLPVVSFSIPKTAFCEDETPVLLSGSPPPSTNPAADFFVDSPPSPAISGSGGVWQFNPALITIPPMSNSATLSIQYTYRDPSTQCSNQSAPISVTVNRVPTALTAGNFVAGRGPVIETCQSGVPLSFSVIAETGVNYRWYTTPTLIDVPVTSVSFNPGVSTATPGTTPFYVTRTRAGCQSPATTVSLVVNEAAVADAGLDQLLCVGNNFSLPSLGASLAGSANGATSFWTIFGGTTGRFLNTGGIDVTTAGNGPFTASDSYEPSTTDIANGFFRLRLFTNDPVGPCPAVFDEVRVTINSVAQANAGADITVCAGQVVNLTGLISGAATTATWTDGGRPGSTLPPTLNGVYIPAPADLTAGASFTLTLTTNDPAGPCDAATDNLTLTINQAPTVSAGLDRFVCQGGVFSLGTALPTVGGSANSAIWTVDTGVPGTFVDNTGVSTSFQIATFTPDLAVFGQTRLRLTTNDPDGAGPCTAVSDDMILTTNRAATVNAGSDNTFCAGQTVNLSGSTGGSASLVTWSRVTGSGGSFGNTTAPITTFSPTVTELATGATITFRLTTNDPDGSDPATGPCPAVQDDVTITINQRPEVNAGPDQSVCADEPVTLLATLIGSASAGTWTGGTGLFTTPTALASGYNFSTPEQAGNLTVNLVFTTNDSDGAGPCTAGTDEVSISVRPVPGSPVISDAREYCVGEVILPLEAVGAPGSTIRWYRDAAISLLAGTGSSFSTGVANTVASVTPFYATQTVNGCESNVPAAMEEIVINPLPLTQFTESDFCLDPAGNGVDFVSTSTVPGGSVVRWGWVFGDLDRLDLEAGTIPAGTHQGATTGSFQSPSHRYRTFGTYSVVLTSESDKGCTSSASKTITVEPIPEPNFQFGNQCSGDNTRFDYIGTFAGFIGGSGGYAWSFGDAGATSALPQPAHRFTGSGNYSVQLTVSTNLGCTASRTKTVSILPVVSVTNGNRYSESFEAAHGWFSEGFTPRTPTVPNQFFNSWQVTSPGFPEIRTASHGTRVWITRDNALGTYRNEERSVLNSPCLVINNSRPVVSFDFWNSTDERRDGAYVEVSTDNGVTWNVFGNQAQGLNWYNTDAITGLAQVAGKELTGPIGQSVGQIGWSGQTNGWKSARIALDQFGGNRIRLRFVFGSNPDQPGTGVYDGFALDNFSVDSRNRLVLVENFTNAAAPGAAANNDNFRRFQQAAASEMVKVQYHTSFPGSDPVNAQSAVDLNARAAFYGVTAAPRGFVDGVSNAPFLFTAPAIVGWDDNTYNTQALATAPIALTVTPSRDNSNLNVAVSVSADKQNIPGGQYILFVGVLEGTVGSEQFVLRKFLPTAAGTPLPALTVGGTTFTRTFSWPIDSRNFSATTAAGLNLSVIAFVQAAQPDAATQIREVLQAAINTSPVPLFDNFTTGLEGIHAESIATYPNPASNLVHVELPFEAPHAVDVVLIDQLGKRVAFTQIAQGTTRIALSADGLAAGVYILQLGLPNQGLRKKILIAR